MPRREREDRRDRGERQLEPRIEDEVRVPREQRDRAEQQRVPRVAQPAHHPGDRRERAGDSGADDRRLRADGQHVRADPGERTELAEPAVDAEEPGQQEHAAGDQHHVLTAHREQVVEARRAEVVAEVVGQRLVVAEDDSLEDRAPFSREPGRNRRSETRAQVVGDAAEPAAPADLRPFVDFEHDMHPVATEPGALVEPALRTARPPYDGEHLEDGPLRRGAAERELELDALVERFAVEATDAALDADVVAPARRRRRDDHDGAAGTIDLRAERTAVERVETLARPPPAEGDEQHRGTDEPRRRRARGHDGEPRDGRAREPERVDPRDVGRGQAEAERAGERVGWGARPDHGTTWPRRLSIRVGPMPEIASSWSTDVNGPCSVR